MPRIQREFSNCRSTRVLAGKVAGTRFQDMGNRKPSNFQEPTRTLLMNAKEQEMIPPSVTSGGIELLAVCKRTVIKAEDRLRDEKIAEFRQAKFERLARKHLRDLMDNAIIEDR